MSAIAFLRDLLADGVPLDAALIAADRFEQRAAAVEAARIAERREKDAARQQAKRERERHAESRGVTRTPTDSRGPAPHVGERTQVVTPSLPSLRSEELERKKTPVTPIGVPSPLSVRSDDFATFWAAYPNKTAKLKAEPAYAKALKRIAGPDPPAQILAGVDRAKLSRQWLDGFIPHPATWLNGGCWEDQPAETIPRQNHDRVDRNQPATGRAARRGVWAEIIAEERRTGAV